MGLLSNFVVAHSYQNHTWVPPSGVTGDRCTSLPPSIRNGSNNENRLVNKCNHSLKLLYIACTTTHHTLTLSLYSITHSFNYTEQNDWSGTQLICAPTEGTKTTLWVANQQEQLDIQKGFYSERFLFRKIIIPKTFIPKDHYSKAFYPKGSSFWRFFIPKGHYSKV